jgi:hypothetical protein
MTGSAIAENRVRRIFETDEDLGGRHRQAFASPDKKGTPAQRQLSI